MKTDLHIVAAVLCLAQIARSESIPTANLMLESAHSTCLVGSEIDPNPIKNSLNGYYVDDIRLAQYFQCMFRMYGLLDMQGNLKNETMYDAIRILEKDHSYTVNGVDACQNETLYKDVSQNEIAYEFFKCFRNYTDSAYYWSILKYLLNKQRVYAALTPTESLKLETVHYTCAMGSDVQLQPIKDCLNAIYADDNNNLTEYFQCVFRMYGYIDASGNLKNQTMFNSIPKEDKDAPLTEEAIKTCQHVGAPTLDAAAYEFFKCFRNETDAAEYWSTLEELSSKNDKQVVSNVLVDFFL